jgi:hydroxymethylbilane synthase
MSDLLRLGTRGSLLAREQSQLVANAVSELTGRKVELVLIQTEGDNTDLPFSQASRPGVFVSALRDALLAGEVDFIVHSFKDLPSAPVGGISLAAVPHRQDPRDVLVSKDGLGLAELAPGAIVGTSSPRRAARVRALRPDLRVEPIRGNVDTRLAKVANGEFQATLLAAAGLNRLGRSEVIAEYFDFDQILPAPAQGALAVECRTSDTATLAMLAQLNHSHSLLVTTAERAVLRGVNASCTTAIGAISTWEHGTLTVSAELSHPVLDWHERAQVPVELVDSSMLSEASQIGGFVAAKLMDTDLGRTIIALGGTQLND